MASTGRLVSVRVRRLVRRRGFQLHVSPSDKSGSSQMVEIPLQPADGVALVARPGQALQQTPNLETLRSAQKVASSERVAEHLKPPQKTTDWQS